MQADRESAGRFADGFTQASDVTWARGHCPVPVDQLVGTMPRMAQPIVIRIGRKRRCGRNRPASAP